MTLSSQSTSALLVLRGILPQQLFGHDLVVGDVLVHRKDVRRLLRLVRAQAARRVEHARRDVPSGPRIEPIGRRQRRDRIVSALCGVQQSLADLVFGHAGIEAEEGVGEIAAVVVHLRREVVGLGLAQLAGELGVLVAVMDVVRQRAFVVEELRVHGPAAVLFPESVANDLALEIVDRVAEQNLPGFAAVFEDDETESFVGRGQRPVVGGRRRGEPSLVDAAALAAESVIVIRVQLDPPARHAERTRHPRRREPQNSLPLLEGHCSRLLHGHNSIFLSLNDRTDGTNRTYRSSPSHASHFFYAFTFSHAPFFAEASTASQTYCVARASRKVGDVGCPLAAFSRKSAT